MAHLPQSVIGEPVPGLPLKRQGKVREVYALPDFPGMLLAATSDRISIFDFVLAFLIQQKGQILNALNIYWRTQVIKNLCEHDLVAYGVGIDEYLPADLRGNPELHKRATVIHNLKLLPVESIVRNYLTGNGLKSYLEGGKVGGQRLPSGLVDGSALPFPIYTPSTKAEKGHDVYITADEVAERYGFYLERRFLQLLQIASEFARSRGIVIADTKFESDELTVADEMFTPDSSRFWDRLAREKAMQSGKLPPSLDKEFVRTWGKSVGIDKLGDPENPEQLQQVAGLIAPLEVISLTTQIYRYIFWRLTGMKLEKFQQRYMGIDVVLPKPKIDIILGSRSDLDQISQGMIYLASKDVDPKINIISCHRNPAELAGYVSNLNASEPRIIIAAAGMAAQLPGMLKAFLCENGKSGIPVIGVAMKGASVDDDNAAMLSIERLPGQPVELDENGSAYFGLKGMERACKAALNNEFLPKTIQPKPAEFGIDWKTV